MFGCSGSIYPKKPIELYYDSCGQHQQANFFSEGNFYSDCNAIILIFFITHGAFVDDFSIRPVEECKAKRARVDDGLATIRKVTHESDITALKSNLVECHHECELYERMLKAYLKAKYGQKSVDMETENALTVCFELTLLVLT
uniref:14_3_3 domain-containing protein n=1 Tax=Panagrellus redivivus TaxID=6233 RepID=A0A7E4ZWT7_PANRE